MSGTNPLQTPRSWYWGTRPYLLLCLVVEWVGLQVMFWCLVRLSIGALSWDLYANPLEMAIQSAVACTEAKDGGLLVSWQLIVCVLVWGRLIENYRWILFVIWLCTCLRNWHGFSPCYRLIGVVVKASALRVEDPGFESCVRQDFFWVKSYQWLKNWHSSGYPARRLVSVYFDWVGWKGWSAASISVWQHVTFSELIRPRNTLACCWDVKQPTNKNKINLLT